MPTTHRSELVTKVADALTDEAYDGSMGPMSETEFPRHVLRLAETAVEVFDGARITIRHEGGNTVTGTIEEVLSTHLAKGWSLASVMRVECPHWETGRVTLRKGCTACAAEGRFPVEQEEGSHV